MDLVLRDIGLSQLGFTEIRDKNVFFGIKYGIEAPGKSSGDSGSSSSTGQETGSGQQHSNKKKKTRAVSLNDPRAVKGKLRGLQVNGNGREKIVTLQNEMRKLNIKDHPHAFCFLLRSMFELSAIAYCADQTPAIKTTKNGYARSLASILSSIVKHMTQNGNDKYKMKQLHGAITELEKKKKGLLSVTSMNQLIHHPSFSIQTPDLCVLFGNVFPLLQEMNK